MKQENEKNTPTAGGVKGTTLFQSNAVLSTNPLAWRGASDARIPLFLVTLSTLPPPEVRAKSAAVFVGDGTVPQAASGWLAFKGWNIPTQNTAHAPACACCVAVGGLGRVLAAMAQERARGVCEFFGALFVVCTPENKEIIRKTLEIDNISTGLYGLKEQQNQFFCY